MDILIAEDDRFIGEGLCDLLETEGYTPHLVRDGEEVLKLYQRLQPDLLLLDIMMPKRDGYSVCREIRKSNDSIPVIFISAKSEEIDRVLGLELGADDYIMKPFGKREVIARIRAVARRCLEHGRPKEEPGETLQFGDLMVYPEELRARRGDQAIELSLRDVKILRLLHQNRGKVVTRDQLFNACWGHDYLPSSRTLDQHISKLRKLIEIDAKAPKIIGTVHGVGYRVEQ